MVTYRRSSATAHLINELFGKQQLEPSILMEIANIAAIRELVKEKVAVAILAPWIVDQEMTKGLVKMRVLGAKSLRRRWSIMHRARGRLGLAEEEFIKLCRRHPQDAPGPKRFAPASLVTAR